MGRVSEIVGLSVLLSSLLVMGISTSSSADISSPTFPQPNGRLGGSMNMPLELKRPVTQEGTASGVIRWSGELGHPDQTGPYCGAFSIQAYKLDQGNWVGVGAAKIMPSRRYECTYQVVFLPKGVPVRIQAAYVGGRWKMGSGGYASGVTMVPEEGVNPIFTIAPTKTDVSNINFKPRISVRID